MQTPQQIPQPKIDAVLDTLARNGSARVPLPGGGTFLMDRPLPFLAVYRRPPGRADRGTERLVTAEAAYVSCRSTALSAPALRALVLPVLKRMCGRFGAFLLVEVWSASSPPAESSGEDAGSPSFRIHAGIARDLDPVVESLANHLGRIKVRRRSAAVEVVRSPAQAVPGLPRLVPGSSGLRCATVGIEVAPIFRDQDSGAVYPLVLRALRRGVSRSLKRAFHDFATNRTTARPASYLALGRRLVVMAVWEVDQALADIAESFDFLLQATPANIESALLRFQRGRYGTAPEFVYRPLPIDPSLAKRKLYRIPVERIEDPTLERLFREKQLELDRKLTMMLDRGTRRFLYGSLQLYGPVDPSLLASARDILERLPARDAADFRGGSLDAEAFAELAREEMRYYRRLHPGYGGTVHVRGDTFAGLMVSNGRLLIGAKSRIPRLRARALLNHEIGTHLVTYFNGKAQPFRQLAVGLAAYEELQEGLAVLAEYLVGGLTAARLRFLAARVVAAHAMTEGADFVEVFRLVHGDLGFAARTSFTLVARLFRAGGLTKDAVYLRGLLRLLDYLAGGGELEPLFVGRIAVHHIPLVKELALRRILLPVPFRPRFLEDEQGAQRLAELRLGPSIYTLVQKPRTEEGGQ